MPKAPKFINTTFLSLGTGVSRTNTRLSKIIEANKDGTFTNKKHAFEYSKNLHPCGIFSIPTSFDEDGEPKTIRTGEAKYINELDDTTRCAQIKLAHQAAETEITAYSQVKKAKADNTAILETLKPLRKAWQKTNPVGRLALEVRILNYLRNGKDL